MAFGVFLMSENLSEYLSCNADIEMPYCRKSPLLTNPIDCVSKYPEMTENTLFMYVDTKQSHLV